MSLYILNQVFLDIPESGIFQSQTPSHSVYLSLMALIMLYLELHLFSFILSWWHFRANRYHLSAKCEGNEAENQGGSGIGYWRVIIKMQSYTHVPFMEAELKMWLMEQDTLNPYRACVKIKVQGETSFTYSRDQHYWSLSLFWWWHWCQTYLRRNSNKIWKIIAICWLFLRRRWILQDSYTYVLL